MTDALIHRGPDSSGYLASDFADVGFRRLSIIDLAGGDQPLSNEDGTIECFLNGEIYNYRELRVELQRRGHRFMTESDTEVLPHLYEEHGSEMFTRLNGMFAICIVDHREQQLILARDHFGVKQMYYVQTPQGVAFASEVKGLLASGLFEPRVDQTGILAYLTLFYCPEPNTLLEGVKKLPPGHMLKLKRPNVLELHRYYRFVANPDLRMGLHEAADRMGELLAAAVERQIHADVPVGISLSGGLDSSALAYLASRATERNKPLALTITWPGTPNDEVKCAKALCEQIGLQHEVLTPPDGDPLADVAGLASMCDEPIADPALYSQFCVARAAAGKVKVLLSGAGADELFGGYYSYRLSWMQRLYAFAPESLRYFLRRIDTRFHKSNQGVALAGYRKSRLLLHCLAMSNLTLAQRDEMSGWLGSSRDPFDRFKTIFEESAQVDGASQQMLVDLQTYLPDQVLPMVDRATMAASVEGRVPFLDVPLVEFAFNIPSPLKVGTFGAGKRVLKQFLNGHIPDQIISRRKSGMPSPFEHIITERGATLSAILLAPGSFVRSILSQEWLRALLETPTARRRSFRVLYALLVLEIWHERFVRGWKYPKPECDLRDVVPVSMSG